MNGRSDPALVRATGGASSPRKAVFLDKDGTLIRDVAHNVDPERMELLPHVLEGLSVLKRRGYLLFVVTNQPGIAHGLFGEAELDRVWHRLNELVEPADVRFEGFYYCPHGLTEQGRIHCSCHKPRPGLLWRAAVEHDIDLGHSWMVGDILNDVEAGHGAGCRSVLIDNGGETEWRYSEARVPDVIAHDMLAAVRLMDDHPASARSRGRVGLYT